MIYTDGYNHSGAPTYFPIVSYANYLGEFSDNRMPEVGLFAQSTEPGRHPQPFGAPTTTSIAFERLRLPRMSLATPSPTQMQRWCSSR